MRTAAALLIVLLAVPACKSTPPREPTEGSPPEAKLVALPGAGAAEPLHGFLYLPAGAGPFPAVLWNHGSEKTPGWQPALARFYTDRGFVFFLPHRRGHGRSPGPYISDAIKTLRQQPKGLADPDVGARFMALQDGAARDVEAALAWLKQRPEVDPRAIVMSGVSFGGIQTLLAAEKPLDVRAFVAFAPGAIMWKEVPALATRMQHAVKSAKAPVLVVQAENDFGLAPSHELGPALAQRADGSGARVFPAFGATAQEGHGAFATQPGGIAVWGGDVVGFFKQALARGPGK